jgi:alanyl-tRNA synthetase
VKSAELREKYLAFFEQKGCKRCPSSSLVPDDPSMLLTSAGMVQFKPWFLQQRQLETPFIGTTTVQKCVRTTDIDIIGTTGRHLSFFEMLGNFSFGAYFKQEMCAWAYEFSTSVLGFDPKRLYFTVYLDDDETIEIWRSLGVSDSHISRLGAEDNFWVAGPTGPCGPCSELYYDQGEAFGCGRADCGPGCDCDRYLEYWNLVFTQYDRQEDGSLVPLPNKNIDTGMGLERTAAILQGVRSNYETDILRGLIALGERLSGKVYGGAMEAGVGGATGAGVGGAVNTGNGAKSTEVAGASNARDDLSLRIVADHARAVTFMIADGILPANEGRGYVLRRLLRRAVRHGQVLGIEPPFLGEYVQLVIAEMAGPYPELKENQALIERIVRAEEERFTATIRTGQAYLDEHLAALEAGPAGPTLAGKTAFELHDRYGFPIDLTVEIAAEQGVEVDREGFERHMEEQRARARAAVKDDAWGTVGSIFTDILRALGATRFEGYTRTSIPRARVTALIVEESDGRDDSKRARRVEGSAARDGDGLAPVDERRVVCVDRIGDGQRAQVILDVTPFYGEMGGQVGDTGELVTASGDVFTVEDTKVHEKAVYAHIGRIDGTLAVGDVVRASIDELRRERIERNHTGTHLLHYALREILGEHVKQAGSLVAPERLRFDFTHFEALTPGQIALVEKRVNDLIMEDSLVSAHETSLEAARADGVTALFGEKYGETVRVLEAGPTSRELCGGTHVDHTAQIGLLKIVSESSVGSSLRRIEAVTSFDALEYLDREEAELKRAAALLKTSPTELGARVAALQARVLELEAEVSLARQAAALDDTERLLAEALDVGYPLVVARADGLEIGELRSLWDALRARLGDRGAVVLGSVTANGTPLLLAAGTPAAVEAGFDAGAVIKQIAPAVQGGGGGKAAMAQAGGKDASGLDAALDQARQFLSR